MSDRLPWWRSGRLAGLVDQGLFSVVALAQTAIYARHLEPEGFGRFAVAMSIVLVCHALHWGLVVMPMIVAASREQRQPLVTWLRWHLLAAAMLALACIVMAALLWGLHARAGLAAAALLATAIVPGYLTYEHFRRQLFLTQRHGRVMATAAAWTASHAAALVLVLAANLDWIGAIVAVAVACALAAGVAAIASRVPHDVPRVPLRELWRQGRRSMLGNAGAVVPYLGYNNAMPLLVGAVAGPAAAGVFSATRLFLAPVTTLSGAIGSVDKPRAAHALREDGYRGLGRVLAGTGRTLLLVTVVYALAAAVGTEWLLANILGPEFVPYARVVHIWLLVGLVSCVGHPVETGLVVLDRAHVVLMSRVVAAAVALAVLLVSELHGPLLAVVAVLSAWVASTLFALAGLATRWQRQG